MSYGPGGSFNLYQQPDAYSAPTCLFAPNAQVSPQAQQCLEMADPNLSGKISASELNAVPVNGKGKNFSDNAFNLMITQHNQIQRLTEAFIVRDNQQNGAITIGSEDFLTIAVGCSY